jgi:hypothetical protein
VNRWLAALCVAATCGALPQVKAASVPPSVVSASNDQPHHDNKHQGHHHHHDDDKGATPAALAERQRLIDTGEASLVAGDVNAARVAFEQAANMAHMADIELGLLRTQMQAGEYRQALAFAAHTAGVHLDDVEGAAFYAWLLNLGAQVAIADQALKPAEAREPKHPMLLAVRERLQSGAMLASGELLRPPARFAPFSTGAVPSAQAKVVSAGLLLADGQHALVPRSALKMGAAIWLRNGLGQTVQAKLEHPGELQLPAPVANAQPDHDKHADHEGHADHEAASEPEGSLGLITLHLAKPLPTPSGEAVPPRDAFPGSPAYAVDMLPDDAAQPAWPVMRAGFVGTPLSRTSPWFRLGVNLPVLAGSTRGGPVYDQAGRLVGLALRADAVDRLVPISALRARFGERFGALPGQAPDKAVPAPAPSPVGADGVYERAMKTTLQVLVALP